MSIRVTCPRCETAQFVDDDMRDEPVRCDNCRRTFRVDDDGAVPGIAAAPRRRQREENDERRSRKQPARRGGSGKIWLWIGLASVPALALVVFGIWYAIHVVTKTDFSLPTDNQNQANAGAPVFDPRDPQVENPFQPNNPQPTTQSDPPPADLVPAALLPGTVMPLDAPPPPAPAQESAVVAKDGRLPPEVLQKVKQATVYLRVTLPDGRQASGSGFFALEPGIVMTNAHVVGMLRPSSKPPKKVDVVLHSGEADERTFSGEILGVDRPSDLAVLRVTGKDLPPPLIVSSARDLNETQPVYVFGFPFGEMIGKNMTVSTSSVSSLRKENGILHRVQVHGGMNPGNSGGPVVDDRGRVIGVAVSVILATQINFAVPGDLVHSMLQGRIMDLKLGQPYRDADKVKVPVTVRLLDPLGRVQKVGLDWWLGSGGGLVARPASATEPASQPGDSPRQTVELKRSGDTATGELTLPGQGGLAYWLQPWHGPKGGSKLWATALLTQPPPPVDRKSATLAIKHETGSRTLEMVTRTAQKLRNQLGGENAFSYHTSVKFKENTRAVNNEGIADVRLEYQKVGVGGTVNNQPSPQRPAVQWLKDHLSALHGELQVDREGNVVSTHPEIVTVPGPHANEVDQLCHQVQQTLQTIVVPLPGKLVEPGQTWQAKRTLQLNDGSPLLAQSAALEMTYTYVGTRQRNGRPEAVVLLESKVDKQSGMTITARATGAAVVDLTTGQVAYERAVMDFDIDLQAGGMVSNQTSGTLEVQIKRTAADAKP